jgi:hypothetical protein
MYDRLSAESGPSINQEESIMPIIIILIIMITNTGSNLIDIQAQSHRWSARNRIAHCGPCMQYRLSASGRHCCHETAVSSQNICNQLLQDPCNVGWRSLVSSIADNISYLNM